MHLLLASAALVSCTVITCELMRLVTRGLLRPGLAQDLLLEVVCTLQLSCCTREMILLGTLGGIELWLGLALTYLLTVLHCTTTQGTTCNPCGSLEQWVRVQDSGPHTVLKVAAQFVGAALSRVLMPNLWLLGLSPLHEWDVGCRSPLNVAPWQGALVEMTCALILYLTLHFLPRVQSQYQAHVVAFAITAIVYAGAPRTGAVFNPALAFAVVFSCQGHSFLQYVMVYWIGPTIGMVISVLILERSIPKLRRDKSSARRVKRE
ncbi:aquaporin-11 [Hyla sarda]|uniref:aquaporin-11 n=1 Tax=Hyla sarda TaxID=327740 RepID=UPI0024C34DA6|nr:aquaporin-11 [Hyla sarda]